MKGNHLSLEIANESTFYQTTYPGIIRILKFFLNFSTFWLCQSSNVISFCWRYHFLYCYLSNLLIFSFSSLNLTAMQNCLRPLKTFAGKSSGCCKVQSWELKISTMSSNQSQGRESIWFALVKTSSVWPTICGMFLKTCWMTGTMPNTHSSSSNLNAIPQLGAESTMSCGPESGGGANKRIWGPRRMSWR